MKKSLLLAALLAGFAGVANAQNGVTVYGLVDIGYTYSRDTDSGNNRTSVVKQSSGNQSGSRLGFKGSEDLGNGMKGVFVLEHGFNADTGNAAQGGRLFGRQAWVGLETNMGNLRLGRQTTVASDMFVPVDPFGAGFDRAAMGKVFIAHDTNRLDNAITYLSPDFSGFKFGVNYSTQADEVKDGAEVQAGYNNRWISTGVSYTTGDLYVTASYDRNFTKGTPGVSYKDRDFWAIGATYDLKFLKIHAALGQMDGCGGTVESKDTTCSANIPSGGLEPEGYKSDVWLIGVSAPIGASSKVFASYKTASDWDTNSYSIGYTYDFSKRTNVYAAYNYAENLYRRQDSNNRKDTDWDQLSVGIRHRF